MHTARSTCIRAQCGASRAFHDCCPDRLNEARLKRFFDELVVTHSWSTVKTDRNGLQFFYKHVLNKQ
jgi:hypothetical protein